MKRVVLRMRWALAAAASIATAAGAEPASVPQPLLRQGEPVDWWFVFKFNAKSYPGCPADDVDGRQCIFGGEVQHTPTYEHRFSQQFAYASSRDRTLQRGDRCVGASVDDPLGATFAQVHQGPYYYVVWNDQFKGDPKLACGGSCSRPWAHSKGLLAWNDDGQGLVMQVTTPSWPGAGSQVFPRKAGNTLGCVSTGNNVMVSQHFFALRLTVDDLILVLKAMRDARVVTAPAGPAQIVRNGGPADVQALVNTLGTPRASRSVTMATLSTGVRLISKPAALQVPPWQMVSAVLGATPLRVATWWQQNRIFSTSGSTVIGCWDRKQLGRSGAVEIATSGQFDGRAFDLVGGSFPGGNHAKIGVSTDPARPYAIFGDMNQEGGLRTDCADAQNPRGGLFYVLDDRELFDSVTQLLKGDTAPRRPPKP